MPSVPGSRPNGQTKETRLSRSKHAQRASRSSSDDDDHSQTSDANDGASGSSGTSSKLEDDHPSVGVGFDSRDRAANLKNSKRSFALPAMEPAELDYRFQAFIARLSLLPSVKHPGELKLFLGRLKDSLRIDPTFCWLLDAPPTQLDSLQSLYSHRTTSVLLSKVQDLQPSMDLISYFASDLYQQLEAQICDVRDDPLPAYVPSHITTRRKDQTMADYLTGTRKWLCYFDPAEPYDHWTWYISEILWQAHYPHYASKLDYVADEWQRDRDNFKTSEDVLQWFGRNKLLRSAAAPRSKNRTANSNSDNKNARGRNHTKSKVDNSDGLGGAPAGSGQTDPTLSMNMAALSLNDQDLASAEGIVQDLINRISSQPNVVRREDLRVFLAFVEDEVHITPIYWALHAPSSTLDIGQRAISGRIANAIRRKVESLSWFLDPAPYYTAELYTELSAHVPDIQTITAPPSVSISLQPRTKEQNMGQFLATVRRWLRHYVPTEDPGDFFVWFFATMMWHAHLPHYTPRLKLVQGMWRDACKTFKSITGVLLWFETARLLESAAAPRSGSRPASNNVPSHSKKNRNHKPRPINSN